MFFTNAIPVLSIGQTIVVIGGVVTMIFTVLLISWHFNKRFDKKVDKKDMDKQLEKICGDNTASHAKLEAKTDQYFELIRDQIKTDRELIREEMKTDRQNVSEKIELLIRTVEKNGNGRKK